jgi:hypothetical protein
MGPAVLVSAPLSANGQVFPPVVAFFAGRRPIDQDFNAPRLRVDTG